MKFGEAWLVNLQKWLGRRPNTGEIDTAGSAKAARTGTAVGGSGKARSSASAGAEPGEKREGPLTIKCSQHADKETYAAALCLHIAASSNQGLHQSYGSYQARPDAWCNECELTRLKEGEWNERCDAFAGFKILCCYCYDDRIALNDGLQIKLPFLKKCIDSRGWCTVKYYGNDRTVPSAFYTIGLTSKFDHPELFVSGLSRGLLDHVVEHFVNRISAGRRFGDGHKYSDLVGDTECCLRAVRPEHFQRYMPEALEILESASTALQCVWPDAKNKYPWDEGFAEDMRNRQPNLWQ